LGIFHFLQELLRFWITCGSIDSYNYGAADHFINNRDVLKAIPQSQREAALALGQQNGSQL